MKAKCLFLYLCLCGVELYGHEQIVHQAITLNAAAAALNESSAYSNFINVISSDLPYAGIVGATNYLGEGSVHEDDAPEQDTLGGHRSLNHFYDPTKNPAMALTEQPPPLPATPLGRDSFTWASVSNCVGLNLGYNKNTMNIWSWQNARSNEWLGLTAIATSDRNAALTNMFRGVGQVMHLLEDTSQPQHVRNEQYFGNN